MVKPSRRVRSHRFGDSLQNLMDEPTPLSLFLFDVVIVFYFVLIVLPMQWMEVLLKNTLANLIPLDRIPLPLCRVGSALQSLALRCFSFWIRPRGSDSAMANSDVPSISFAGGGMLWPYYLGVAHYIYENYDLEKIKFLGSSAGSFAAVPLVMGMDPYDWCRRDWVKCINHYESRSLGSFLDSLEFYQDLWDKYLPEDAHLRANNRLFLSITLFPRFENCVVSSYPTRKDLINCLCATMCLPIVFLRSFPRTHLGLAIDGGLTNDQPCFDANTVRVSILDPKAHIKPSVAFPPSNMIRVPSLDQAFATANRAAADAHKSGAFQATLWENVRKQNFAQATLEASNATIDVSADGKYKYGDKKSASPYIRPYSNLYSPARPLLESQLGSPFVSPRRRLLA